MSQGSRREQSFLFSFLLPDLIKVGDDLVEEPQTFQSFLVDIALGVKFFEIWH